MKETITDLKIISLIEGSGERSRYADITFENWRFKKVDFKVICNPYNYGDWMFLRDVAERILSEQEKMTLEHPVMAAGQDGKKV